MATLEELQAQRTRTIEEIQRRKKAGQKETPDLTARLATTENQIRTMRASPPPAAAAPPAAAPPAQAPPPAQPSYINDQLAGLPAEIKDVATAIKADAQVANVAANRQEQLNNPDQINPFGTQTTKQDAAGNVTVESKLSESQQQIATQDESLTKMGNEMAQSRLQSSGLNSGFNPAIGQRTNTDPTGVLSRGFDPKLGQRQNYDPNGTLINGFDAKLGERENRDPNGVLRNPFQANNLTNRTANTSALDSSFDPNLTARTSTGDTVADRRRIEDSVFASLTRNVDRDAAKSKDEFEQSLANRGIPIDPNDPQYREMLRQHNERYDTLKANAQQDAVKMGGDEYSRSTGTNETMRANDFSQQAGARAQNAGEASTLGSLQESQRGADYGQQLNTQQQNVAQQGQNFNQSEAVRDSNFNKALGTQQQVASQIGQNFNQSEAVRGAAMSEALGTSQQNAALSGQAFGQQETANANDFTQNQAVRNQNLNEIGAISGLGTGLQVPNFQPYQAPNFQLQPASTTAATVAGIGQGQQALDIQEKTAAAQQAALRAQAAQSALSGRGGGNSTPQTPQPPPFA